jgi:hypothetical protein
MNEREKLIYVQGVIDRLLYLPITERTIFLSKLDRILNESIIEKDIKYMVSEADIQEADQG